MLNRAGNQNNKGGADSLASKKHNCPSSIMITLILLAVSYSTSGGQEILHPSGHDIVCEYSLSAANMHISDTLVTTWTITNNEDFVLSGLYLAENLPFEFDIVSSRMAVDDQPVPFLFSGAMPDQIIPGYNTYRWVIDLPGQPEGSESILGADQMLNLQYEAICETPGSYILPFHTACFYGNGSGFFTTSDTLFVVVQQENDIPTLSWWGMFTMALLLLAAGTTAAIRRRKTVIVYRNIKTGFREADEMRNPINCHHQYHQAHCRAPARDPRR
jgi:hypothetical protein